MKRTDEMLLQELDNLKDKISKNSEFTKIEIAKISDCLDMIKFVVLAKHGREVSHLN